MQGMRFRECLLRIDRRIRDNVEQAMGEEFTARDLSVRRGPFRGAGPLRGVVYCHCSQCRHQSGHYYAATNVADADLTDRGRAEHHLVCRFANSPGAAFAPPAVRLLFWKHNEDAEISVMAGAFDRPSGLKGESHIFVVDKGDYYDHRRRPAAVRALDARHQGGRRLASRCILPTWRRQV